MVEFNKFQSLLQFVLDKYIIILAAPLADSPISIIVRNMTNSVDLPQKKKKDILYLVLMSSKVLEIHLSCLSP